MIFETKTLCLLQGLYFFVTGVWPIVSISSFQAVTGPKVDLWLVKTVGALIAVVGAALVVASATEVTATTITLAIGSAAALAAVDINYVARRRIAKIYLLDALLEIGLIALWVLAV